MQRSFMGRAAVPILSRWHCQGAESAPWPHTLLCPILSSGFFLGLCCSAQDCSAVLRVVFPAQNLVSQLRTMSCCLGPPYRATFCSRAMISLAGGAAADPGVKPMLGLNLCWVNLSPATLLEKPP